ncbi:hypothetical protein [Bauldia sp.]|uniref:hypothetical protein n=1 Tax=Bauldia sp. TaxID=2575872 RepID=UPI003BAA6F33
MISRLIAVCPTRQLRYACAVFATLAVVLSAPMHAFGKEINLACEEVNATCSGHHLMPGGSELIIHAWCDLLSPTFNKDRAKMSCNIPGGNTKKMYCNPPTYYAAGNYWDCQCFNHSANDPKVQYAIRCGISE